MLALENVQMTANEIDRITLKLKNKNSYEHDGISNTILD